MLQALEILMVTTIVGQIPAPCMFPIQFETRMQTYNVAQNIQDVGRFSYDGRNHRIFQSDVVTSSLPGKRFYERIALYEQGVQYTYDKGKKECTKTELPAGSWRDLGVPGNATFKVQVELGSIGDGFTANEFDIFCDDPESGKCHFDTLLEYSHATVLQQERRHVARANANDANKTTSVSLPGARPPVPYYQQGLYTVHTCLPVSESLFTTDNDLTRSVFNQYADSTLGISDPNIFTRIPSICADAPFEHEKQRQQPPQKDQATSQNHQQQQEQQQEQEQEQIQQKQV